MDVKKNFHARLKRILYLTRSSTNLVGNFFVSHLRTREFLSLKLNLIDFFITFMESVNSAAMTNLASLGWRQRELQKELARRRLRLQQN